MRVLLLTAVAAVLAAPLFAAPPQGGVARPLRRRFQVPANPVYSPAQWDEIMASQALGQEVCVDCAPGTEPQHPLAGKVAATKPKPRPGLRIIHGTYASDNEFPWMVNIHMDTTWRCGGTVISDTFVLTAAQCASGYNRFVMMLGDTDTLFPSDTRYVCNTYKAIVHEDYSEDTIENDIGILQLLVPLKFSDAIRPIKLPTTADVTNTFEGQTGIVSGWGVTIYGYPAYDLMYTKQPVMSNKRCARFLGSYVRANVICGDAEGNTGACTSDEGGPLIVKGDDDEWKQIGIYSFGSDLGCTWGYPNAYTRVTEHLKWIQDKTGILP